VEGISLHLMIWGFQVVQDPLELFLMARSFLLTPPNILK
jgi:hypothetical protein